jgi:hypothetical protein
LKYNVPEKEKCSGYFKKCSQLEKNVCKKIYDFEEKKYVYYELLMKLKKRFANSKKFMHIKKCP